MKASRPRVLGQRASFWVSAGVVTHIFWTSAAPAMTYRLYAEQWHLTPTVTTGIFAVYPIIVVAVLVGFGDLSDHIGRRLVMLLGLGASLIGTLLFAVAPGVLWLFAGRALTGIGVGLTAGTATAALVDFSTEGQSQRAASVTPAAQAFGFTGALLLGGALTQYAPWPTHLGFWLLFALIALLFAATWFLPRRPGGPAGGPASGRWRPKSPAIPAGLGSTFALSASAVTTAYTHGVLILSVGGQVGHDLVGSSNALVNGAALSLFAITSGMVGISARGLRPRWAMLCGAIASVASMGLLALSVARQGLPIFLAATTIAGIGYSLLVLGGLRCWAARSRKGSGAACSPPSICSPTCRWASWRSAWASWRPSEGSAWRWIWAPPRSPRSASARSASSPFSGCTSDRCPPRRSAAKAAASRPEPQSDRGINP